MGNAAQFAIEIDRELAQVFDSWREAVIFIAREALADIVSLTPVDTGRA